jgi:hypothetical protein
MQQVSVAILKKQDPAAASSQPFRFGKSDAALFKFGPGRGKRFHSQCDVPKAGEFVVPPVFRRAIRGVNLEPAAARQPYQKGRRMFTVIENFARPQDALIPCFQRDWIRRWNRDVLNGDIHPEIKVQIIEPGN